MSMWTGTQPAQAPSPKTPYDIPDDGIHVVIGNRQMLALGFVALAFAVTLASIAYMAGRLAAPSEAKASTALVKTPEQVIVVDGTAAQPSNALRENAPAPIPNPASLAANAAQPGSSISARAAAILPTHPVAPEPAPSSVPPEAASPERASVHRSSVKKPSRYSPPVAGETYLQIAAVEKGMADVSADYLEKKGLPARVADGATAGTFRVLIGPLGSEQEMERLRGQLEESGFKPFVRKY